MNKGYMVMCFSATRRFIFGIGREGGVTFWCHTRQKMGPLFRLFPDIKIFKKVVLFFLWLTSFFIGGILFFWGIKKGGVGVFFSGGIRDSKNRNFPKNNFLILGFPVFGCFLPKKMGLNRKIEGLFSCFLEKRE